MFKGIATNLAEDLYSESCATNTDCESPILDDIKQFLLSNVYPHVNSLDKDSVMLLRIFKSFKDKKFFSIYVNHLYGGKKLTHLENMAFQEMMGQFSGAFSFLQAQTATACWIIENGSAMNKSHLLFSIAAGFCAVGNATSYMKPTTSSFKVTGENNAHGYTLSGKIDFASGFKFFDKLLIGFNDVEHGMELFALIDFKEGDSLKISDVLDVLCMSSMNTVTLELNNLHVNKHDIVAEWKNGHFYRCYKEFKPYTYTVGLALEALRHIKPLIIKHNDSDLTKEYDRFVNEIMKCQHDARFTPHNVTNTQLFSFIIRVCWQTIQFSILVSGGMSLSMQHSLQRLYREMVIWIIPRATPQVVTDWSNHLSES